MLKKTIYEKTSVMYSLYILNNNLYNVLSKLFKYRDLLHLHELCWDGF